jgi:hypothetical protein
MPREGRDVSRRLKKSACPWQTRPSHSKNRELQVNADRPIIFGHCPQDASCAFCAGTLYKPNLLLQIGRPFLFVPCPCCEPELYRKRFERLKALLPKGSGPPPPMPPAPPPPDAPPDEGPPPEGGPHAKPATDKKPKPH